MMKQDYHGMAIVPPIPFSPFLNTAKWLLAFTILLLTSLTLYGQGRNDLGARACVQDIGNGLYKANFTYENPRRRAMTVTPEQSRVAFKKGRKTMQGITTFHPGTHKKAFSVVFGKGETVTWTITNPSGRTITVEANSSASFCQDIEETDFIFPVYGENGKTPGLLDPSSYALATGNGGEQPSDIIYQLQNERLLVEVVPQPGQLTAVVDLLQNTFALSFNSGDFLIDPDLLIAEGYSSVDCFVPVARLLELNQYQEIINFVRTNYVPLFEDTDLEAVAFSEGDSLQGSLAARRSFGTVVEGEARFIDGSGFFTGVISDSFDKLPSATGSNATFDVGSGDLPGAGNPNGYLEEVMVLDDYPGIGGTDEGRAMMHIIHDVAPGSKLAFHYALTDQVFAYAVDRLNALGVDMIGDDITFVDEEFDGGGPAGQAIRDFLDKGDTYFVSAAGNFLDKGFTGVFTPGTALPENNFDLAPEERAHVFGTNPDGSEDYLLRFAVEPGVYLLAFQWDESFASTNNAVGASSDLDMYVVDDLGRLLVGNNSFSTGRDALEIMTFSVSEQGEANIMIVSEEGAQTPPVPFRVIAFRYRGLDFLEYGGAPTISGHAAVEEVITVGAVDAFDLGNVLPRSYSSFGGILPASQGVNPDIAAPDGVRTAVEGFERFFGTSAAGPHVMGAIALLKPAYDVWYAGEAGNTASSIFGLYEEFARPVGDPAQSGAGFIDVESTFSSLAARAPVLEKPVIDPGINVSAEVFELTLTGKNFTSDARVYLNGEPLELISVEETQIVVQVPEFSGKGLIYVEVLPKTPSGTEIVTSNVEDLLDDKTAITIAVDSLMITYGHDYEFSSTVSGLPEGTTLEELGFPAIEYATPAVAPFPDVRSYLVTASFPEDPDADLLDMYKVNFRSGIFTVKRKDLEIRPLPASYTYGDLISLEMEYRYTEDSITQKALFLQTVREAHESGYFPENTFALVNRFRTVLNGEDILSLLNNNAWMVSDNTIKNRFRTVLNGMDVIDLEMDHFEDYLNADDPINNRFRTVLNRFRTVLNGQDFFDGLADVSFENRFRTVLNDSGFGGEEDDSEYASTFTIIDEADVSTDAETRSVGKLYALNLITGLDVTPTVEEEHYTYPGVLLHPIASNFNVSYDLSRLRMDPATLTVSTGDLFLEQGEEIDSSLISYFISGYVYNETEGDVFPEGVNFAVTDASGQPYEPGDFGVFTISVQEPRNYTVENASPGVLYVNPSEGSKIRTYFDCVQLNPDAASDGYAYIANFRYINPNPFSLFLTATDNFIEAEGRVANDLPVEFLPGEHKLRVRFDGEPMTWNVCTFGSCNPSSVGKESTLESNRCTAKDIANIDETSSMKDLDLSASVSGQVLISGAAFDRITTWPNPVSGEFFIHPGPGAIRSMVLYDIMGRVVFESRTSNSGVGMQQRINTESFYPGIYMLKIVTTEESKTIKVVKQ